MQPETIDSVMTTERPKSTSAAVLRDGNFLGFSGGLRLFMARPLGRWIIAILFFAAVGEISR